MPSKIPYVFWGNNKGKGVHSYWVHDNRKCRLAAALEGHSLSRHTTGDNPEAVCRLCGLPFVTEGPVIDV